MNTTTKQYSFPNKVWITGGIFSLIIILLLLIKATFNVFILILAGILIAVYFRGLSDQIHWKTNWRENVCLTISTIGTVLILVSIFWMVGTKIQEQVAELSDTLPSSIEHARAKMNGNPIGENIVKKLSSPNSMNKVRGLAKSFFQTTFGVLGDVYVVLFLGIFFTVSPNVYKKGLVKLIPENGKSKGEDVLNKLGTNLKKWLKGKLFAMFVVFVLTAIGLVIIDVPLWFVLALIAGILNFIPNFGPLIAMIPAVLLALMQGADTAALVAGLYIMIQVAESNFITPMVQQKLISIPPALIIIAQLLVAPLTGGWGLVLATPLMLIAMVLVDELYIKKQNLS